MTYRESDISSTNIKTESEILENHKGNAYLLSHIPFNDLPFWYLKSIFKLHEEYVSLIDSSDVFCYVCKYLGEDLPLPSFSDDKVYKAIEQQSEASQQGSKISQPCNREKQIMGKPEPSKSIGSSMMSYLVPKRAIKS
jgi:hypothetical protein